jgi:hypothetical protein
VHGVRGVVDYGADERADGGPDLEDGDEKTAVAGG